MMIIKGILLNVITVGSQLSSFYNVHQSSLCQGAVWPHFAELGKWVGGGEIIFCKKEANMGFLQEYFFNFTEVIFAGEVGKSIGGGSDGVDKNPFA